MNFKQEIINYNKIFRLQKIKMNYIIFTYKWNSRELKKIITTILKSGISNNIKKFNYIHNYSLDNKNIEKSEEKIILIQSEDENKLTDFLSKNFPQKIERINLK